MATLPAIRYIASSSKSTLGVLHLRCHVKPGASKQREGIISVSDSIIELCVTAQAKEGEANKAVREVFSSALKCPKSDVEVVRGLKSREKIVAVSAIEVKRDEKEFIVKIRDLLQASIY